MGSLSIWHWLIVLLVVVLVFGTKKLKNIGQDLGGAVKGFKEGMREAADEPKPDDASAATKQQVTDARKTVDDAASTIDVEAKTKS